MTRAAVLLAAIVLTAQPVSARAVLPPQAATAAPGELPDLDCIRLMRQARVAELGMRSDERADALRKARSECNEPTAALVGLLRADRRKPLPADEVAGYRRELIAAIEDQEAEIASGVLEFIVRNEDAGEPELQAAFDVVERRLLEGDPDRRRLLRMKVLLEQRLGRSTRATEALLALRGLEPANEEIAWALLRLLVLEQRWGDAADLLGEMAEGAGSSMRSLHIRALGRAGRVAEANRQLRLLAGEIDRSVPLEVIDYAADALAAAWNLRDSGRPADAEDFFRLAAEYAPAESWASAEARGALVHLYGTAEQRAAHQQADADRWQEVADPSQLLNEGANQMSAGNFDRAIELLLRASEEMGHLEAVWYNLGIAYYRAERWEEAFQALDRAAALNAGRVESSFFSGLALVALERWEEALSRLLRTVELDPERGLAHYNLWVCYKALGHEEEAALHQAAYDALR